MPAVPYDEAVEILRRMLANPDKVRAVRGFRDGQYGPFPFFVDLGDDSAEVTMGYGGGVIENVASVRVGYRFTNLNGWPDNPWDELSDDEYKRLETSLTLKAAAYQSGRMGSG